MEFERTRAITRAVRSLFSGYVRRWSAALAAYGIDSDSSPEPTGVLPPLHCGLDARLYNRSTAQPNSTVLRR